MPSTADAAIGALRAGHDGLAPRVAGVDDADLGRRSGAGAATGGRRTDGVGPVETP